MAEWISLQAVVKDDGDRVVLTFEPDGGAISLAKQDARSAGDRVEVRVGAAARIVKQPAADDRAEPSADAEAAGTSSTTYACVGAMPNLHIPGSLIDCQTGKIIGPCMYSYPCPGWVR
jgi:hypothetical protein